MQTTTWLLVTALGATAIAGCSDHPVLRADVVTTPAGTTAAPIAAPPAAATLPSTAPVSATPAAIAASAKSLPTTVDSAKRAPLAPSDKLRVKRLVIADSVANREPVGTETAFDGKKTDRIYAFVEVENAS